MKHNPYEQMKEAHFHTDSTTWYRCKDLQAEIDCLKAQLADARAEIEQYKGCLQLLSSIWYHGGFVVETYNEANYVS